MKSMLRPMGSVCCLLCRGNWAVTKIDGNTKSIFSKTLYGMLESLSMARKKQLTMMTTRMNQSNHGLMATSWMILFLNGFVTDRQQRDTVA